jgi:hypothetical protein
MQKVSSAQGPISPAPTPTPGPGVEGSGAPANAAAEALRRTGSAAGRAPSALSVRRDSPLPRNDAALAGPSTRPAVAQRPPVSRNSSAGTAIVTQAQLSANKTGTRIGDGPRRRGPSIGVSTASAAATHARDGKEGREPASPVASTSSSSSSSDSPVQSRIIRRPPRFFPAEGASMDDDDDEAQPAFLPFRPKPESATASTGSGQDMGATLRGNVRDFGRRQPRGNTSKDLAHQSQTSDSSTSSAAMVSRNPSGGGERKPGGPLSPRRTAELAGRSPVGKGKGISHEGSDGTPSMGSSFSDLDGTLHCHHLHLNRHRTNIPPRCVGHPVRSRGGPR